MRLLTANQIKAYRREGLLEIQDFDERYLLPTGYYFGLGKHVQIWDPREQEWFSYRLSEQAERDFAILPEKGYALVTSYELFICSDKVLGILGQNSESAREALRLNLSPSIDPGFKGYLEFGIENTINYPFALDYKMRVGKVMFFDISETGNIAPIAGTVNEDDYRRRNVEELVPQPTRIPAKSL